MAVNSTLTYPSTGTLTVNLDLYINPANESYRHKLTYRTGRSAGVIIDKTSTSLATYWRPQPFLARENPDGRELECVFTLDTYESETAEEPLGTETYTMILAIPDTETFQPNLDVTWVTEPVIQVEGIENPVKKGSGVTAEITNLFGSYGADIVSCTLTLDGNSQDIPSTGSYSMGPFDTEGDHTISLVATDSRGYTKSISHDISVIGYYSPSIFPVDGQEEVICGVCFEDGTFNTYGTYLRIAAKKTWCAETSTGGINTCTLQYRYRPTGEEWGDWITLLAADSESDEIDTILSLNLDTAINYEIELMVIDLDDNTKTLSYSAVRKRAILQYPEHVYVDAYMSITVVPQTDTTYSYELYYYDIGRKNVIQKTSGLLSPYFQTPRNLILEQTSGKTLDYTFYFNIYENSSATTPLESQEFVITVEIPDTNKYKPYLDATFSVSPAISGDNLSIPTCTVNKGKLIINDYECEGQYGAYAWVSSIAVGSEFRAEPEVLETPYETSAFITTGRKTATLTAKDTRGFTRSVTYTFDVVDYSAPTLSPAEEESEILCGPCLASGAWSESGSYLRIVAAKECDVNDINGNNNSCNLQYRHRKKNQDWSSWVSIEEKYESLSNVDTGPLNVGFDDVGIYEVEIRVVDSSECYSEVYQTSFEVINIYMHKTKNALGIGEKAEFNSKKINIAEDWCVNVKGVLDVGTLTIGGEPIGSGSVKSVNGVDPDENGNVNISDMVKSVNSVKPDENGNVNVLAWTEGGYYNFNVGIDEPLDEVTLADGTKLVKISNDTPDIEDWIGGYFKIQISTDESTLPINQEIIDMMTQYGNEDGYSAEVITVAKVDSFTIPETTTTVPTKGIWIIVLSESAYSFSAYCPGQENIHKVSPKFLPEGIGYEIGSVGVLEFNGDLNNAIDFVEVDPGMGIGYAKLLNNVPALNDWLGCKIAVTIEGQYSEGVLDENHLEEAAQSETDDMYLVSFILVIKTSTEFGGVMLTPGIWTVYYPGMITVHTIECPGIEPKIHKIDPKYLPAGIGYDEEVPAHTLVLEWDGIVKDGQEAIYDETTGRINSIKIYDKSIPKESWNGAKLTALSTDGTEEEIILEGELYSKGIRASVIPGSYTVLLSIGVIPENVKFDESLGEDGEILEGMSGVWLAPQYNSAGDMGYFSRIELNMPATTEPVAIEPQYLPEGIGYEAEDIKMSLLFSEEIEGFTVSGTTKATYTADTSIFNLSDLIVDEAYIVDIDWFGQYELTLKKIEQDSTITYSFEKVIDEYESFAITETIEDGSVTTAITLNVSKSASTSYHFSIVGPKSYGMKPVKIDEKFIPDAIARVSDIAAPKTEFILTSSTEGSTKQFKITVNDAGVITATEIV